MKKWTILAIFFGGVSLAFGQTHNPRISESLKNLSEKKQSQPSAKGIKAALLQAKEREDQLKEGHKERIYSISKRSTETVDPNPTKSE